MEGSFYQNVYLLTLAVPPSKDFLKYFKEGMFDKPNTIGFLHVSHYLLTIYDAERFKNQLKWPLCSKQEEAEYRTSVKDTLISVARENLDVDFPQILASHLLHASGRKFSTIMWNLSTVALRTWIKRQTEMNLLVPKSGEAEQLSKILYTNLKNKSVKNIQDIDKYIKDGEENAKTYANETVDLIKKSQEELFLTRQSLKDIAAVAPVHPAMKKRLEDPNDSEVIEIWKKTVDESIAYLKTKQERLTEITEVSNKAANMVASIASTDSNTFDGNCLTNIDTNALSEVNGLSPETQIMLHRLYENGVISLENFLSLYHLFLMDFRRYIEKHGYPDLSGCESLVHGSSEDMNSMSDMFRSMYERIMSISNEMKIGSNLENYENAKEDLRCLQLDNDLFYSVILKSSPTIQLNGNHDVEKTDVHKRLELTPVENIHKALFSRHERKNDTTPNKMAILQPKMFVSRINFDDTRSSCTSDRVLSPVNRSRTSKRMVNQSTVNRNGKYSRLFSTYQTKCVNRFNSSIVSMPGSWRNSTVVDTSSAIDLYNMSGLRPHMPIGGYKLTDNRINNFQTPPKSTPTRREEASSTINDDDKSVNKITTLTHTAIDEKTEVTIEMGRSPKLRQTEKPNDRNRRDSISDLVERYKNLLERTSAFGTSHLESSSDISNESEKH